MNDEPNPYEPPENIPQIKNMAVNDLLVFLFLTVGLGFCVGVVTTIFLIG